MIDVIKWEPTGRGNYIKKLDGVFLSYNPCVEDNLIDDFLISIGECEDKRNPEETALKYKDTWMILNGNFMEEYDQCNSAEECLGVYNKYKKTHRSDFSTDSE